MMMGNGEEDKARGVRRKQDQIRIHADGDGIRETGHSSTTDGSKPKRGDRENFKEDDTEQGAEPIGKILSQLRELREAHLAYVNAHSDRLKARLAEDDEHRSQIVEGMDSLEQEILLIQASQKSIALDEEV